ncbi:unnamed protein product, partial [Rotaria sp. Silwood2]
MANRVSSSSYNRNNHRQNIPSSNNRSSRSTFTTHTYASTNTFNTEPTYTTTPITGDPRTLHSYYVSSSNYCPPPTSPTNSLTRHYREYEPSYPSITRYRTPSSSSPFRKTHYLDDSDEEIINEEILEITDLNHYPTLIERWGDDAKTIVRQEGEFKFEDFVEFEEVEPTVVEEILYELVYTGDKLKTCRQIDRSRSESRNFRKIKKRRTKRKRPPIDDSSYLTSQPSSRDTSGTRSPYHQHDHRYSPERSSTPIQSAPLSTSWQSTGFIPNDKSSLDISMRNRLDDQNYVNYVRVNDTDPFFSHTQIQQYPQTQITSNIQHNTRQTDLIDQQNKHFYDHMHDLSSHIDISTTHDDTLNGTEDFTPVISEVQGITKINIIPTSHDYRNENLSIKSTIDTQKDTYDISSSDNLLTTTRTTDNEEPSRTNTIDQTSVQNEINNRGQDYSTDMEKQINKKITSKHDELEKDDEEQSSVTEPTIREIIKDDDAEGKDTDEDASFSESEQISSQYFMSDEQKQSSNLIKTTEQSDPSLLLPIHVKQDDREIISTTTDSSINKINELESQLQTTDSILKSSETNIDRENIKPIQTIESPSLIAHVEHQLPEDSLETTKTSLEKTHETSIPTNISDEKKILLSQDQTTNENDQELRSMLDSIAAHLMPELPRFDEETEDEQSYMSETKSSEEPISQDDQSMDSIVQKSSEGTKELWTPSHDYIISHHTEPVDQTKTKIDQTTADQHDFQPDNKEKMSPTTHTTDSTISKIQETNLDQQDLTIEKSPLITDSLVNIAEQIINNIKKPQNEQVSISQASPVVTDEIPSTQLQSTQQLSQDTEDVTKKQPLNINYLTDIIYEIHSQPLRSYSDKQQIYTDTQRSIESIRQEDRLSSIDSTIESTPSVITSDKQKQQPISSTLSITSEAIEKPTSKDDQSSIEFQSRKEIDEQVSLDSLVNIVRQIHTTPQIIHFPSTDIKTKTTHIIEQEPEKPLVDSHVEIVTTNESIPSELVTIKTQPIHAAQELIPKPSDISLVTEHKQETTSETLTKEDELERLPSESLINADWETLVAPHTSPIPSDYITTETTVSTEKHDKKPIIDSFDQSVTKQNLEMPQKNLHAVDSVPSTSFDSHVTQITSPKTVEDRASEESVTKPLTITTQITEQTISEDDELSIQDKAKTDENGHYSLDALTEIARGILSTPFTIYRPSAEVKTGTIKSVDFSIRSDADILPSTTTTLEETTLNKTTEVDRTQEAKEHTETGKFTPIDKSEEQPTIENLTTIVREVTVKLTAPFITHEESSESREKQQPDVVQIIQQPIQHDEREKFEQSQTQDQLQTNIETITTDRQPSPDKETQSQKHEVIIKDDTFDGILDELTKPIHAQQPLIDHVKQTTSLVDQEHEKQPMDSCIKVEISPIADTEEEIKTPKDLEHTDLHPTTTVSSVTEPRAVTVVETTIEKPKPTSLSTEKSTITVPHPLVTPDTAHLQAVDHKAQQIIETEEPVEKPSLISVTEAPEPLQHILPSGMITTEEETPKPADTIQHELKQPSITSSVIETVQETTTESHLPPTQEKIEEEEAERLTSEALTAVVHDILATPLAVHLSTIDHKVKQITEPEQQVEQPSLTKVIEVSKPGKQVLPSEVITKEEEATKPADAKQKELEQPSITSSVIEIVQETTTESHPPPAHEKIEEQEAERLTSEILTEVVHDILATPLAVHHPIVDDKVKQISETEQQVEQPSLTPVTEVTKSVAELSPTTVITIEQETIKPADAKQKELEQPSTTSSVIEIAQETTTESHPPPAHGKMEEQEAERLTSEILTEVVHDILATPLAVHLPIVHDKVKQIPETEQQVEQLSLTNVTEVTKSIAELSPTGAITKEEETPKPADMIQKELEQPSITSSVIEIVQETTTESHSPSTEDRLTAHEAERLTSKAISEAVREILATPVDVHLPTVDHAAERQKETDQLLETQHIESLNQMADELTRRITASVITTSEPSIEAAKSEEEAKQEVPLISTVIDTTQVPASDGSIPLAADRTKGDIAEAGSLETLTEVLREILSTPLTVHLPTAHHTAQEVIKTEQVVDKPSSAYFHDIAEPVGEVIPTGVIITEEVRKPTDTNQIELQQPTITSSIIETEQETETETESEPSTAQYKMKEEEAECLTSESLTEVVHDILATPLAVQLSTVDHKVKQSTEPEQQVEKSSLTQGIEVTKPVYQMFPPEAIATEEETSKPGDTNIKELQQPSIISTVIETVRDATTESHTSPAEEKIGEQDAERLTSEALAEVVHDIVATPVAVHLSTLDHQVQQVTETKDQLEKAAVTPVTEVTKQVEQISPSEVITTEEETSKAAENKQKELQEPTITSSVIETVQETTTETHAPIAEDKIEQQEAERLTSEILTEVVHDILATPLTVHVSTVDDKVKEFGETERKVEQPSLTEVIEVTKPGKQVLPSEAIGTEEETSTPADTKQKELDQPSITSAVIESVQETTTESHPPSAEDKLKEHGAELLTSEALTEVVHDILATPLAIHLPTADHKVQEVTERRQQVEKPSLTEVSEVTKPVEQISPSEVIATEEETSKLADTDHKELRQPSIISPAIETVEETTTESHPLSADDELKGHEAEFLTSEAITEAVREILATPVDVHLPTVDRAVERPSGIEQLVETQHIDSVNELANELSRIITASVTTTSEVLREVERSEEIVEPMTDGRSAAMDTAQVAPSNSHIQPAGDRNKEDVAEGSSLETLTEVVREILATPLAVHLPTVKSIVEKTTTTNEEEVEQPSSQTYITGSEHTTAVAVPIGITTKGNLHLSDTKPDEVQLIPETKGAIKSMEEETTKVDTSSGEDTTSDLDAVRLSSVNLDEAVPDVSDTSISILRSSVDAKPETVDSIEQLAVRPEIAVVEKFDIIPENFASDKTISMIADVVKTPIEKQHSSSDLEERIEDDSVSIDSLVGSVHEILATPLIFNLSSVETDRTESQDKKLFQKQLDSSTVTSKPEDIEKPVAGLRHSFAEETERIPLDSLVEVTREILTTSSVKDKMETIIPSEKVEQPIDSLIKIVDEVVISPKQSGTDVDTEKKEILYTQPQFNESDENVSLISGLTSSKNDQLSHQSAATDIIEQASKESSLQDIISSESKLSLRPTIVTEPIPISADESIPNDENEFISSSLYTAINAIVNNAINNACNIVEQSILDEDDNQSFVSFSSKDEFPEKIDTDINLTNDIGTKSVDDYHSISGLTNIVNSILKLPNEISSESSISHEDNKVIVSPKSDFDKHINISHLSNIVDTIQKTLNIQTLSPEQSDITEPTSSQRASAVQPTFYIDDVDQDTSTPNVPTFFIPETPTGSEANFRELYEHRHFISNVAEEPPSHFTPIDRQESVQSVTIPEDKKVISDSPLAYYELQEKRHTLMSPQESTQSEKPEQISSSLTTWTTMQPLIDYEEKEKKQDMTDINLDDHAYECARRFDLESPSIISNLPTKEYRQVFGVPDEIVTTVDDMTHHIDQTLSMESKHDKKSIVSDDVKNISSQFDEQLQSDDGQFTIPNNNGPVSDNVKKIIEALEALESDLLEHKENIPSETSFVTEPVEHLISQQNVLSSNVHSTALDNDIKETLEHQTLIFPSKDEYDDDDLLPKKTEAKVLHETIQDEINTNSELDSRYSKLFEHIDNLEKPIIDIQSSSSSIIETETKATDIQEEKDDEHHLQQRYDTLIDHVATLQDATIKNLLPDTNKQFVTLPIEEQVITSTDEKSIEDKINIDGLAEIIEHITVTPFRTVISSYEKRAQEEPTTDSNLQMTLEQILVQTQHPTTYVKLPPPIDTVSSSNEFDDQQKAIQQTSDSHEEIPTSTSTDKKQLSSTEETPNIEEKDPNTIFEKVTSVKTDASPKSTTTQETISSIDSTFYDKKDLPSKIPTTVTETSTIIESGATTEQVVSPFVPKDGTAVLTSSIENEKTPTDKQQLSLITGPLEIISITRPTTIPTTETPVTSLNTEAAAIQHDYIESSSSPLAGYFSSSDVYHAYKQPIEPIIEHKPDSSSFIHKATAFASS